MRISTESSLTTESTSEIKKQVKLLLKAAGVGDKLPVPKEDIVTCSKLVEIGQLDLSKYEEDWLGKGLNILKNALSKIRGLIDFKQKVIYVDPNIHPAQKTFVTYHEVSHRILPWHEGIYNPHVDTDYSIDPRVSTGLESEANLGASLIQFQIDRFTKELKDFPLGLGSAIHLAQRYETSLHSTFRKYVEDNHKSCALLVLEVLFDGTSDNQRMLQLWYSLQSYIFTLRFGKIDWEKLYFSGHPIYDTVLSDSLERIKTGEIVLKDLLGFKKKCRIEAFYNTFNYFVLIFPIPHLPLRKKIIIVDS